MKKLFLFSILAYIGFVPVKSQNQTYSAESPHVIPSTPQSQIFERYLNHSITEYNGLPEINIPLYEIEIKGLKIPIILSYHAGGVKYQQSNGDVGVGWSINVGGYRVSRTVYGRPDEVCRMYNQNEFEQNRNNDGYLSSINGIGGTQAFLNSPSPQDGEHDQFTYMLPTSNGHFIISDRGNRKVTIIEQNPDKIILDENQSILKLEDIKVIDSSGFTYYMGGQSDNMAEKLLEKTYLSSLYTTGWPLRMIVSSNNEIIKFKYSQYDTGSNTNEDVQPSFSFQEADLVEQVYNIGTSPNKFLQYESKYSKEVRPSGDPYAYKELLIENIDYDIATINFERSQISEGILQKRLLNSITIKDKNGGVVKKIIFDYSLPTDKNWHCLLKSIRIIGNKETELGEKYQFSYYNPPAENIDYTYPDQWGFYAKRNNYDNIYFPEKKLALHCEFLNEKVLDNFVWTYGLPNYYHKGLLNETVYSNTTIESYKKNWWFNRSVNENTPCYFSLKEIRYPTGGTTKYEYECNQVNDVKGGGQRIKRIISKPDISSSSIITEFKYGENENGNGISNLPLSSNCFVDQTYHYGFVGDPFNISNLFYVHVQPIRTYSMKPIVSEFSNTIINYPKVSTYKYDSISNKYIGKIISMYNLLPQYDVNTLSDSSESNYIGGFPLRMTNRSYCNLFISGYKLGYHPVLLSREFYNNDKLIKKESYTYTNTASEYYLNLYVKQRSFFPIEMVYNHDWYNRSSYVKSCFAYMNYKIFTGKQLISSKKTYQEEPQGEIVTDESYEYDNNYQLTKISRNINSNSELIEQFKYSYNYTEPIFMEMNNKNIISPVIEKFQTRNGKEIGRLRMNYMNNSNTFGLILPESVQTSTGGSTNFRTDLKYDLYDEKGNIRQYTSINGLITVFLWGYNGQYPIAKIEGASYENIKNALVSTDINSLFTNNSITQDQGIYIRNKLKSLNVLVTFFTYKPLVGITSISLPNGVVTTYEYDSLGRLIKSSDHNGKIIKQSNYYLKP